MKKKSNLFVGIAGATTPDEVNSLVDLFNQYHTNGSIFLNGILVNANATQYLHKKATRYPDPAKIKDLLIINPKVLNIIHITKSSDANLAASVVDILGPLGDNWHGVQLNVSWPSIASLDQLRNQPLIRNKNPFIILQVNSEDFLKVNSPCQLAKKLLEYDKYIDHVLLDSSGGRGVEADPIAIDRCLSKIRDNKLKCSIGIAGGLDGNKLLEFEKIIKHHKVSFDAECKLRNPLTGRLDIEKCEDYILAASLFAH